MWLKALLFKVMSEVMFWAARNNSSIQKIALYTAYHSFPNLFVQFLTGDYKSNNAVVTFP